MLPVSLRPAANAASKAALLAMTDSLRFELEPFGVHVTYVAAGLLQSDIVKNLAAGCDLARYERPESLYAPLADLIR
jgi:NAD(P)-dependent dehydrogenase (short-subunit alcohol dehydrogenase family)